MATLNKPERSLCDFAMVPLRAANDPRLKESHLKVLMRIAWHARSGVGCYATHKRMAIDLGLHVATVDHAITELREWGYVSYRISSKDGRLRIYSVIYSSADEKAAAGVEGTVNFGTAAREALKKAGAARH